MAATKIADVIVPSVFIPYSIRRTRELSELFTSGIVAPIPDLGAEFRKRGGSLVTLPFWNDLTGAEEVLSDTVPLSVDKITTASDVTPVFGRGKAWGVNDLAVQLSGDDPMAAIADLTAGFWARRMQTQLIASLGGAFASGTMAANVSDISAATGPAGVISGDTLVDAFYKLGDAAGSLMAFAMHSAVASTLIKSDFIEFQKQENSDLMLPTYLGKRVIIDDGMPVAGGVYTTYLFGPGAIGYADAMSPDLLDVETDRDSLQGDDILINRRFYVMHPRGVKWVGAAAGTSPTNAELAVGANWSRVYTPKDIRIVQFKHRIV